MQITLSWLSLAFLISGCAATSDSVTVTSPRGTDTQDWRPIMQAVLHVPSQTRFVVLPYNRQGLFFRQDAFYVRLNGSNFDRPITSEWRVGTPVILEHGGKAVPGEILECQIKGEPGPWQDSVSPGQLVQIATPGASSCAYLRFNTSPPLESEEFRISFRHLTKDGISVPSLAIDFGPTSFNRPRGFQ